MPDRSIPDRTPSTTQLTVVLACFFVVGAGLALFIWHTLSDFLAGKPVEGGRYLLALAMTGVFVGVAWLLYRYILSAFPSGNDPEGAQG
jgi:drug/metabolite transporter (DMT)-like permease